MMDQPQRSGTGKDASSRPVHYGCLEFRDDSERVIQDRAHPQLAQLYHAHLAFCQECQRYHHSLEAVYRRPRRAAPLDSFTRDREFNAILERTRALSQRRASTSKTASASIVVLTAAAAILALALIFPSFGARLFRPPAVAELEIDGEIVSLGTSYGSGVRIPANLANQTLAHQAQSFARVIGGDVGDDVILTDADGRPTTGDSLTVGTGIITRDSAVQVAFVGRLIANFQPETIARWNSASPTLVEFGLASGMIAIRYDRQVGDPILQVRTPTALVRVIGTVFTVYVDGDQTTVSVLRGRVQVLDPHDGHELAEVEAGFRFDVADSSFRDIGRREVAAALPLSDHDDLIVSLSADGELTFEESIREPGQIPGGWTVPGLSDDPEQRTLDRVLDPDGLGESEPAASDPSSPASLRPRPRPRVDGEAATRMLIANELERRALVEGRLEQCRELQAEPETRFRAARCLGDFMKDFGEQPEAVEGLLLLGTLRMDFAHDYQSATRNFEEFLRRAPRHPKAELARYKLVLAAIEAGYIPRALQLSRVYLQHYPDGHYVGRILQRFPELR